MSRDMKTLLPMLATRDREPDARVGLLHGTGDDDEELVIVLEPPLLLFFAQLVIELHPLLYLIYHLPKIQLVSIRVIFRKWWRWRYCVV